MQFIDLNKQYQLYKNEILKGIEEVLDGGQYILGKQVLDLESKLAEFVGVSDCITVSSGSDSLEIALMALGIGSDDEVITVPFTFIATAQAIALRGAKPVFVDIEPDTYNIDISKIEQAITSKTKAIMPVSIFGQMPDYDAINTIAKKHGLAVIEDGAQSFGATQNGKQSSANTTIGSTSFFPAKPFGCYGDGGALFTNDTTLAQSMRALRTHGGQVRDHYPLLGFNGRFDTIQAAILLAKFPHFTSELEQRQIIGKRYNEKLKNFCQPPKTAAGNTHIYAQYTIRIKERDKIKETLGKKGIPTGVYYSKCLHMQPSFAYLDYHWGDFPVAEQASLEVLSLPMHPWLEKSDQDKIIGALEEAVTVHA